MAKGSETRQRSKQVLVRLSDEEFAQLAHKSDHAGLAKAAFLRATAFGEIGPRAQRRPPADHVALRKLLGELGRVGNNINQIARSLNAGDTIEPTELRQALLAYVEMRDAIFQALNMDPSSDYQGRQPKRP